MEDHEVERLIKISKDHPLLPETYIPWQQQPQANDFYLPENLASLYGSPLYDTLTHDQKVNLGRHEIVQVMYSYAWGEGLFCIFMNKYIMNLPPDNLEYRFLIRELIEEFRHQEMFSQAILQIDGKPVRISPLHRFIGKVSTNYLPVDCLFMGSLSIEMITDMYGDCARKDETVYPVLRKVFQLHNIEEGRHIHFTKGLLERYTAKAGPIRRTVYSYIILFNIYFLRSLYVKKEIFERIGLENADHIYKQTLPLYRKRFAEHCMNTVVDFVQSWNGFNAATRWAWRWLLNVKV